MRGFLSTLLGLFFLCTLNAQIGIFQEFQNQASTEQAGGGSPDPILNGIFAAYDFETNPTVLDLVGSINGTGTSGTTLETGPNGNAIGVESVTNSSWIDFGNNATWDELTEITVFIDWYPTAVGESGTSNVFGNFWSASGNHAWHIGWRADQGFRGRISDVTSNKDAISASTGYALNTWHRVALRWQGNGTAPEIWVNGVQTTGGTTAGAMRTALEGTQVSMDGAYAGAGTRQATGYVDNAFIWDRALTVAEMTQMFTGNPTYAELNSSSGYDADTDAFIAAHGNLSTAQEVRINDLVVGLKADGLWSKLDVIYPFEGSTAADQKWNLKDPQDTDAAHRAEFFEDTASSWTHDAMGAYHASATTGGTGQSWLNTNYSTTTFAPNGQEFDLNVSVYNNIDISGLDRPQLIASYFTGTGSESSDIVFYDKDAVVGEMDFDIGTNSVTTGVATTPDGQGFFTVTTDGINQKGYLNGVEQASGTTGTRDGTTADRVLGIGTSVNGTSPWDVADGFDAENSSGRYTFISIGQVDLTATDAANLNTRVQAYVTAKGAQPTPSIPIDNLVSYFEFEDNASDVGGGNSGTVTNATYNAIGKVGKSLDLDGNSDYVTIPDDNSLSFTTGSPDGAFSMGGWYKFDNTDDSSILISKRPHEYQLGWDTTGYLTFVCFSQNSGSNYLDGRVTGWTPTLDTWYHIYVTYDGSGDESGMSIYIDGVSQTVTDNTTGTYVEMNNTATDLALGVYLPIPTNVASHNGEQDMVGIWNKELTSDEVTAIYNIENGGKSIVDDYFINTLDSELYLSPTGVDVSVTVEGTDILDWEDKSKNNALFVVGGGGDAPTLNISPDGTRGYEAAISENERFSNDGLDLPVYDPATDSFTAIIKEGDIPLSDGNIFMQRSAAGATSNWYINQTTGSNMVVSFKGGSITVGGLSTSTGGRVIILVVDAGSAELFIDGVSESTTFTFGTDTTDQSLVPYSIGGNDNGGISLEEGVMEYVLLVGKAITNAEVTTISNLLKD